MSEHNSENKNESVRKESCAMSTSTVISERRQLLQHFGHSYYMCSKGSG